MHLGVIGTGYVGLVAAVCFAEAGNDVRCVDVDEAKLERLRAGDLPIFEPGLEHLFERNLREGRLLFTSGLEEAVRASEVIFLALPTPMGADGAADLGYVLRACEEIGRFLDGADGYKIVVTKSTVPVGTLDQVRQHLARHASGEFDVVSNPEFLREGVAVEDFMRPERVIIGTDSPRAEKVMRELYRPFLLSGNPLLVMDARSSELAKYAANAMLALRISFMNDIANLCREAGADVDQVRLGVGLDSRIGKRFLFAGIGYGGSCFGKDVQALAATGEAFGAPQRLLHATQQINADQKKVLVPPILAHFGGDLSGRRFALWGLAFKPNTDDMRDAPSLVLIEELLARGATVCAYDPEAMEATWRIVGDKIEYAKRHYDACEGADALVIATEWNLFREPDFELMRRSLKEPLIFDGRNVYALNTMRDEGFTYHSIGRPAVNASETPASPLDLQKGHDSHSNHSAAHSLNGVS
jgi:UDPglucose 6-dehydrogenase